MRSSKAIFRRRAAIAAASQLFDTMKPSAIFACNDMMGIGALRAAAERGISVPGDCSIIGFDDVELSRYTYPALSTVGQSVRALGEMAAQTLIDRIAGKLAGTTRRRVVAPRLIWRESTAVVSETRRRSGRGAAQGARPWRDLSAASLAPARSTDRARASRRRQPTRRRNTMSADTERDAT